jgi:hypothetical protein
MVCIDSCEIVGFHRKIVAILNNYYSVTHISDQNVERKHNTLCQHEKYQKNKIKKLKKLK